jgi:hypothetical protein
MLASLVVYGRDWGLVMLVSGYQFGDACERQSRIISASVDRVSKSEALPTVRVPNTSVERTMRTVAAIFITMEMALRLYG